jgi:hypothetical protein
VGYNLQYHQEIAQPGGLLTCRQDDVAAVQAALQKRCKAALGICVATYLVATPVLREAGLVPPWLLRASLLVRHHMVCCREDLQGSVCCFTLQ